MTAAATALRGKQLRQKSIGTIGGPDASLFSFNAGLTDGALRPSDGYRCAKSFRVLGRVLASSDVASALDAYLSRTRPEVVRICFDASNVPSSADPVALRRAMSDMVIAARGRGTGQAKWSAAWARRAWAR